MQNGCARRIEGHVAISYFHLHRFMMPAPTHGIAQEQPQTFSIQAGGGEHTIETRPHHSIGSIATFFDAM
jgi:hypothetical protein